MEEYREEQKPCEIKSEQLDNILTKLEAEADPIIRAKFWIQHMIIDELIRNRHRCRNPNCFGYRN